MKKQHVIIPIVMLVMLIACSVPASATWGAVPLSGHARSVVWENVTSTSLFIDYESDMEDQYTYHFNVPSGTEVRTQLCIDVWSAGWCGQHDFEFNGCGQGCSGDFPFGTYQFGENGPGCGDPTCDEHPNVAGNGCGGNGVWWNVTGLVTSGAQNDFVANVNETICIMDGRHRGANIVHLYNDPGSDDTRYTWFNQGMEDGEDTHVDIHNVDADVAAEWTLYVCIDCGDQGDTVSFNGHDFTWNEVYHGMDINSYDVSAYVLDDENDVDIHGDQYTHPFWTILVGRKPGAVQEPDLVVTNIEFPVMMRPGINQIVNATILNQGDAGTGNAFNVSLVVDDGTSYNGKVTGVGPLAVDESINVSFDNVNIAEGCHEFNVTADSDDDVDESSNEDNNYKEENYQVGYVIVVKSNSDFADLLSDPGLSGKVTFDGTTYYIQDLTIENCVGHGIYIKDTTVPFVIRDCTVQNCKGEGEISGVYLRDLTKGTVEESTVKDIIGRGLRVRNSTYVDVKDNHLYNNSDYGIEVYPRNLLSQYVSDCQFVNITNNNASDNYYGIELIGHNCIAKDNIASDNLDYGIYAYGNDSQIINNTIENNAGYGMKLYNSSGICVFWNTLVNNNGGGVQAIDEWKHHPEYAFNHWNTTIEIGYYYPSDTCHCNRTGNYWSDYDGEDPENDGIGDDLYQIDFALAAYDYYPLMYPWQNYALVKCGDVDCNDAVNPTDALKVYNGDFTCEWTADVDCNDAVNPTDALKIYNHNLNCCGGCC